MAALPCFRKTVRMDKWGKSPTWAVAVGPLIGRCRVGGQGTDSGESMTAGSERRAVKIRRRGRHTSPSQVEKVAAQAGKAAPAVAIDGALVAVPAPQQALAATSASGVAAAAGTGAHQAAHEATATAEV